MIWEVGGEIRQLLASIETIVISVTRCLLALLVNFTITSDEKCRQVNVIKCPCNSFPQRSKSSNPKPPKNKKSTQTLIIIITSKKLFVIRLSWTLDNIYQN